MTGSAARRASGAVIATLNLLLTLPVAGLVLCGGRRSGLAQTWPTKPIHIIVPFAPGSATDIVPRTVFDQVSGK